MKLYRPLFVTTFAIGFAWLLSFGDRSANGQPAAKPPALGAAAQKSPPLAKKIVLIGGKKSHGPAEHDFPNGIPLFAAWLKASPAFADADVLAYPAGWPADLATLDGASTIVCYFDGVQEKPEPFSNADRNAYLQRLFDAGTGLVCLHQASTVPKDNTVIPLDSWLGASRNGMVDRTHETVSLKPADPSHPVSRGVGEITVHDEFYPTLVFNKNVGTLTPILRAVVGNDGKAGATRADHVLAWAYERKDGGRGFGYTGGHYLKVFDEPQLRKLLLNAIAWTAKIDVPADGITTPPPVVGKSVVLRQKDVKVQEMPWGQLSWNTSAELGNSRTMTTGVAVIKPGMSNPRHFHPNCDEILYVVSGKIRHTMNEETVELGEGDTVSIPRGVLHNATNIGDKDAVLRVSFDSAFREAVGY
jgi:quercetin dioxygenase-like cupin family protein/type 1 glutamine amidotransferase